MKNKNWGMLLLVWILLAVSTMNAENKVLYIAPDGNDLAKGTKSKPLASLVEARNRVRSWRADGDTTMAEIVLLEGDYQLGQTFQLTSDDKNTLYRAEKSGSVNIIGGEKVTNWQKAEGNLWKTFVPQVARYGYIFEQLYVDGKRAVRARTPNNGFFKVQDVKENVIQKGHNYAQLAVHRFGMDTDATKAFAEVIPGEKALVFFYHKWDYTRKYLLGCDVDSMCFYTYGEGLKSFNPINNAARFFLENYRAALDSEGEWFLDKSGWLYYMAQPNQNMNKTEVFYPVLNTILTVKGDSEDNLVSNIVFDGLQFKYFGYQTPEEGNETLQAAVHIDAAVSVNNARYIRFLNCEIQHIGLYAFWFQHHCRDCSVEHCYLADLGGGGVKIGDYQGNVTEANVTKHVTVNNSIITQCGKIFPSAVGVSIFHSSDNVITHNEISDLGYSGVSVGWVWGYSKSMAYNNKIDYNHIHHIGWGNLCDMGAVYTLGISPGTTVNNNVVHHVYSYDYGGWGLYTDEGSTGIHLENNLVYACKNAGFHQHYGKENVIRNNIFAFNIKAQLQASRVEEHTSFYFTHNIILYNQGDIYSSNWMSAKMQSDSNCYWNEKGETLFDAATLKGYSEKKGRDGNSVVADPLFIDADAYDFHFKSMETAEKIGFEPFDYSQAGVYGSEEWKAKAMMPVERIQKFEELVEEREKK